MNSCQEVDPKVKEVEQLHKRFMTLWGEKKKYLESMRRSEEHIREIEKK